MANLTDSNNTSSRDNAYVEIVGSDGTAIGNVSDALKITGIVSAPITDPIYTLPADQLAANDAFHRLRISNPETLYDINFRTGLHTNTWNSSLVTGGTVTHDSNIVSAVLATTTSNGSKAIFASRRYTPYFPGKSQLIFMTGNFKSAVAGVTKRIGYFDDEDGIFFCLNGTTPQVVLRSKVTGTIVDTAVSQSSWNLDKMDGTGSSGVTIDFSKQQLFVMDFQWLGSGSIKFGFFVNNEIIYCHRIANGNNLTTPYSRSGILPLRAEIENTTAQASTQDMHLTCCTVVSEGGSVTLGAVRSVDTGATAVNINTTPIVLMGMRIASGYKGALFPLSFDILLASGNSPVYYQILYNATITGGVWTAATYGIAEILTSATSYSGGLLYSSGYLPGNTSQSKSSLLGQHLQSDLMLGKDIAGTADTLIMVIQTTSGNGSVMMAGQYREYA